MRVTEDCEALCSARRESTGYDRSDLVIKFTLHLPVSEVKLSLRAAVETGPVSSALVGERAAQFTVPATKNSRHNVGNFSSYRLHDFYLPKPSEISFKP